MKKKLILSISMLFLFSFMFIYGSSPHVAPCAMAASNYTEHFGEVFEDPNFTIDCTYSTSNELKGTIDITFEIEKDEAELERFHKYVKKSIDSADIGILFYPITSYSANGENLPIANYKYVVKLPENLKNKDLAVIPFTDERTTSRTIPVNADKDGIIGFSGSQSIYAYAIVYNGIYKELILIGVILLVVLLICVLVKVYCVRRDNPYIQDKKKEKAIKKAKEAHRQNRILAKATKRQKEEIRKKK